MNKSRKIKSFCILKKKLPHWLNTSHSLQQKSSCLELLSFPHWRSIKVKVEWFAPWHIVRQIVTLWAHRVHFRNCTQAWKMDSMTETEFLMRFWVNCSISEACAAFISLNALVMGDKYRTSWAIIYVILCITNEDIIITTAPFSVVYCIIYLFHALLKISQCSLVLLSTSAAVWEQCKLAQIYNSAENKSLMKITYGKNKTTRNAKFTDQVVIVS